MFLYIDNGGCHFQPLIKITDHKSDGNTISISGGLINPINEKNIPKNTMDGWKLQVEWKDMSASWVTLEYLKASNPL